MKSHRLLATAAATMLALSLASCASFPTEGAERVDGSGSDAATPTAEAPETEATPEAGADDGLGDALGERDQFFVDQQQPLDGSALVAKTPEQTELVAQQRAYVESQGGTWNAEAETITLALALDACETSILNGHAVDLDVFRTHVTSSPLVSAVSGGDPGAIEGAVSIMVFGTGFICPDDAPQWEAAWSESGGVY
ncbi:MULTISPECIES: hypothetical protein [unclassified Microbacterium]|uniref:hypothetical protein n=1 Tax=unclassified Microbacterium TaxID=2609290 RepID=UPI00214BB9D9|nr:MULTISPECIES: hypothetical protein [unclassified Microbacterium]MCR2785654.1 hypothetical protein [Microbacterium sp. zg.B96]WIM17361.1 hypothetical protein QNO11_06915 [Microbacterium sp. zg-B96]